MTISTIYYISVIMLFICNAISSLFKEKKLVTCILSCLVLGLLLGLRDPLIVGVDGVRYANTYKSLAGKKLSSIFLVKENKNIFFYFLNWLLSNIGIPYQIFTMINSFFCVAVMSFFIYRFSKEPLLSFALYMGLGFYTFAFSGQKEALAMTFILLSYIALYDGRNVTRWAFFVFAVLSHYTAIIFLPILLIGQIKISKKLLKYLLMIIIPVVIVVAYFRVPIAHWITSVFAEQYLGRYVITESLGGTALFVMVFTALYIFSIGLIEGKNFRQGKKLALFERSVLYICMSACIFQAFSSYAYAFTRLTFYFLQFFVISVPYSLWAERTKRFFGIYYPVMIMITELALLILMVYLFFGHIEGELLQEYRFMWE